MSVLSSHQAMFTLPVRKTSRSLSPTRSTIAFRSSSAEIPCWIALMTANSALRCAFSFFSRWFSARNASICAELGAASGVRAFPVRAPASATAASAARAARASRSRAPNRPTGPSTSA